MKSLTEFWQNSDRITVESRRNPGGIQAGSQQNHGAQSIRIRTEFQWEILKNSARVCRIPTREVEKHQIRMNIGCWWLLLPVFNLSGQNSWWISSEKQINILKCSNVLELLYVFLLQRILFIVNVKFVVAWQVSLNCYTRFTIRIINSEGVLLFINALLWIISSIISQLRNIQWNSKAGT